MKKVESAMAKIPESIMGLMSDYKEDIESAWMKREDTEDLTLSFSAKLGHRDGKNVCEVSMSFTKEKIKDKTEFTWDETQLSLFGMEVTHGRGQEAAPRAKAGGSTVSGD